MFRRIYIKRSLLQTFGEIFHVIITIFHIASGVIHPYMFFEFIGFINQVGVWSIFTISFKGVILTLEWLLEFILMTASSCFVLLEKSKFPFCEEDGSWYVEIPNKIEASLPENFDNIKKDMEKGDFKELIRLSKDYKPGNP